MFTGNRKLASVVLMGAVGFIFGQFVFTTYSAADEFSCQHQYEEAAKSATDSIGPWAAFSVLSGGILSPCLAATVVRSNEAKEMQRLISDAYRGGGQDLEHLYGKYVESYDPKSGVRLSMSQLAFLIRVGNQSAYFCGNGNALIDSKLFNFNHLKESLRTGLFQQSIASILGHDAFSGAASDPLAKSIVEAFPDAVHPVATAPAAGAI
jgi:hypothetical protein